jgi:hypothetical protein
MNCFREEQERFSHFNKQKLRHEQKGRFGHWQYQKFYSEFLVSPVNENQGNKRMRRR